MYTQIQFISENDAPNWRDYISEDTSIANLTIEYDTVTFLGNPSDICFTWLPYEDDECLWNTFIALGSRTSFSNYINKEHLSDIEIRVTNNEETKSYKLHKIILENCSEYFKDLFSTFPHSKIINIVENIDYFEDIINLIYGKAVKISGIDGIEILLLMDKYQITLDKNYVMDDYISAIIKTNWPEFEDLLVKIFEIYYDGNENIPIIVKTYVDKYYDIYWKRAIENRREGW